MNLFKPPEEPGIAASSDPVPPAEAISGIFLRTSAGRRDLTVMNAGSQCSDDQPVPAAAQIKPRRYV